MDGIYIVCGLGFLTLMATFCLVMDIITPSDTEIKIVKKNPKQASIKEDAELIINYDDD